MVFPKKAFNLINYLSFRFFFLSYTYIFFYIHISQNVSNIYELNLFLIKNKYLFKIFNNGNFFSMFKNSKQEYLNFLNYPFILIKSNDLNIIKNIDSKNFLLSALLYKNHFIITFIIIKLFDLIVFIIIIIYIYFLIYYIFIKYFLTFYWLCVNYYLRVNYYYFYDQKINLKLLC